MRPGDPKLTVNGASAQSKEGGLLIFPAWLKHTVPANDGRSERISISCNLMSKDFSETMAEPLWGEGGGVAIDEASAPAGGGWGARAWCRWISGWRPGGSQGSLPQLNRASKSWRTLWMSF